MGIVYLTHEALTLRLHTPLVLYSLCRLRMIIEWRDSVRTFMYILLSDTQVHRCAPLALHALDMASNAQGLVRLFKILDLILCQLEGERAYPDFTCERPFGRSGHPAARRTNDILKVLQVRRAHNGCGNTVLGEHPGD